MYALSQARRALAAVDLRQGLAVSEVRDRLVQGLRLRETGQRILAFYLHEMEDLAALAVAQAGAEGFQLDASAGERLAVSARGTPRELLRLLDRVLDEAAARRHRCVDGDAVESSLARMGYDDDGLDPMEQRYLALLHASRRPVPLGRLARMLGASVRTLIEHVEPFLFRRGLIQMTPRGRTAANVRRLQPA